MGKRSVLRSPHWVLFLSILTHSEGAVSLDPSSGCPVRAQCSGSRQGFGPAGPTLRQVVAYSVSGSSKFLSLRLSQSSQACPEAGGDPACRQGKETSGKGVSP